MRRLASLFLLVLVLVLVVVAFFWLFGRVGDITTTAPSLSPRYPAIDPQPTGAQEWRELLITLLIIGVGLGAIIVAGVAILKLKRLGMGLLAIMLGLFLLIANESTIAIFENIGEGAEQLSAGELSWQANTTGDISFRRCELERTERFAPKVTRTVQFGPWYHLEDLPPGHIMEVTPLFNDEPTNMGTTHARLTLLASTEMDVLLRREPIATTGNTWHEEKCS